MKIIEEGRAMVDASIWNHRANLTIQVAIERAIDRGASIDEVENIVRSMRCPFTSHPCAWPPASLAIVQVWIDALDAVFAPEDQE